MDEDENQSLHPAVRALKTICRCNNIKYRTIERAIREGAHTLNQVASRTTATTGECGGSCTPEVQALIAELAPKYATAGQSKAAAATTAGQPGKAAANPDAWWVRKN
jgi:NAD(P)H-nitrite reductase large subunit